MVKRTQVSTNPREAAWLSLCDYENRQPPWDGLLRRTLKGLNGPDRGLAAELLTGTLRHRRWVDHVASKAAGRPPGDSQPPVWNLIRMGTYQLLFLNRVPPHAALNETVELAKRHHPKVAGFVNAALRNVQRLQEDFAPIEAEAPLPVRHSLPDELWGHMATLTDDPEALATALNDPGPLGIRLNSLAHDPGKIRGEVERLIGGPLIAHAIVPDAWLCDRVHLETLRPLLDSGRIAIQDPASQLVSLVVAPRPGQRIVDLCASPGGKAAHLAALMGGEGRVIATDRDRERLHDLRENMARMHARGVEVVDWAMAEMLMAAPEPDAVLIDGPCSGWGTVRHKPDLKWRSHDSAKLAAMQRQLLDDAAPHLCPGGVIIHSVCTFLPGETTEVVAGFLADHPQFAIQDAREVLPPAAQGLVEADGSVRTWPHRHGCDGFYAARLIRR